MTMTWHRDGDQWVSHGTLGEYRITEWIAAAGSDFIVTVKSKGASKKAIFRASSLPAAQYCAETHDGYRANGNHLW